MPIKIIADYRELLIDILFAIIIAVGFERFVHDFLLKHIQDISSPPIMLDTLFFFAAYFWVISHWVSYHELITKYPYYRWRKFFVDIFLFSGMFIIVNISYFSDQYEFGLFLVWLLTIWYIVACLWHLSDRGLRPLKLYLKLHISRIITYAVLLLLLYDPLRVNAMFPSYQYGVIGSVILAMILWNVHRLTRFTRKDSRFYLCNSISGYPGRDMPNGAQLELIISPIKKKLGYKGKDSIKFGDDNLPPLEILAEDIRQAKLVRTPSQPHGTCDLRLQIDCKLRQSDGTVKDINIVFDLDDEIIVSVGDGIKELLKRYKDELLGPSDPHLREIYVAQ